MAAAACSGNQPTMTAEPPHLVTEGQSTHLVVNGKQFLALSGELDGSSSSSAEYMAPIWPKLREANLTNVLAVVSWEQIEPREGEFDFTVVDDILKGARANDLKVSILWFGSWKNGVTTHTPIWVKNDQTRFPLVKNEKGETYSTLSTVSENNWTADAKAFGELMKYIRKVDAEQQTIIMVQVENEIGIRGMVRDFSDAANALYASQVPAELMSYLSAHKDSLLPETLSAWSNSNYATTGTWSEVFGDNERAGEIFMAWNYSSYVNKVAEAGKAEYPIPMFVNAWIVQPEDKHPGEYPCGGPQAQNHDIWRAGAPNIDILAPDIYLSDFPSIIDMYTRSGNPGFIPESRTGKNGAANIAYAIGENGAIGYSYMGVTENVDAETAALYGVLRECSDIILDHRKEGKIHAVWLPKDSEKELVLGNYKLKFSMKGFWGGENPFAMPEEDNSNLLPGMRMSGGADGYAIIMEEDDDEYTIIGCGTSLVIVDANGEKLTGLARVREGRYENNQWIPLRWLNGDQTNANGDIVAAHADGYTGQGFMFMGGSPTIIKVKPFKID